MRIYMDDYDQTVVPGYRYPDDGLTQILWYIDLLDPYVKNAGIWKYPSRSNYTEWKREFLPEGEGPNKRRLYWSYAFNNTWNCCGIPSDRPEAQNFTGDPLGRYILYAQEAAFAEPAKLLTVMDGCTMQIWAVRILRRFWEQIPGTASTTWQVASVAPVRGGAVKAQYASRTMTCSTCCSWMGT